MDIKYVDSRFVGLFSRKTTAIPLWLALAALVGGAYLLVARLGYGVVGFPLDDAWIHQTYARNLATIGQWAFIPGETSAGSTSPLWSLLLSLGYWLGIPYPVWTFGLGIIALGLTGWTASRLAPHLLPGGRKEGAGLAGRLLPARAWVGPLAGLGCIFEWHLVWASVSGMETILYTWLSLLVVDLWLGAGGSPASVPGEGLGLTVNDQLSADGDQRPAPSPQLPSLISCWELGILGGLLALTRPEGLGLIGLIGLATGWRLRHTPGRLLQAWLAIGVGLALPVTPYLAFHYATTGLPFPNTFYAKQQEYRLLLELEPFWRRWLRVAAVTLVGGQVLLLPGFVYAVWRTIFNLKSSVAEEDRSIGLLLLVLWWIAHLTLYALRLPVTYQHGRYQIPVIPFFLLVGVGGMADLLRLRAPGLVQRAISRSELASVVLVSLIFLGLGGRAYATDVAFIQGEMVAVARWLETNVSPDSLIAVHDIGAIGYFAQHPRPLLDLAGLVTPEVIPFMTDETRLLEFMQERGADYVVFFPDWSDAYRRLAQDPRLEKIYVTGYEWTLGQGRANMTVYRLKPG